MKFKIGDIIRSHYEGDIVLAKITSLDEDGNWEAIVIRNIKGDCEVGEELADDNWIGITLYKRKGYPIKLKGFKFRAKNKKHVETTITKI